MVMNCPIKHNKVRNITSGSYSRSQSNSSVRGRSRSLSPYPRVRFEDSDRCRSSARKERERTTGRKSEYSNDANATCGACSLYKDSIVDTKVSVGLPVLTSACKTESTSMPVTEGRLGEVKISVLRDTGCSGVVVRKCLIDADQLTGVEQTCMLADGSKIKVPIAEVIIDTPYYIGKTEAWCMESPIYDLIIGNINGAREPNSPDPEWTVNAVQTRQQVRNQSKPYSSLKVPEAIEDINPKDIIAEQQNDSTLRKLYSLAEEGKTITSRGDASVSYLKKNDILYRKFQSRKVQNGKEFTQLVVPLIYRRMVMKLAHESI